MQTAWEGTYGPLLQDPDIRRWYENLRRGFPITADVYLRRLGSICRRRGVDPPALIAQTRSQGER